MNYRLSLFLAILWGVIFSGNAMPAWPGLVPFTQPDGTQIQVKLDGDAFGHKIFDASGRRMQVGADGFLRAATSTEIEVEDRGLEQGRARRAAMRGPGLRSGATLPHMGDVRTLVILVEFSDVKFTTPNPLDYFTRFLNQEGFSDDGDICSVRDYFIEQSGGQFRPQFDVYGPVAMNYTIASNASYDNFYKIVRDATSALDSQINFADYDLNGDGAVDNVFIICAGLNASYGSQEVYPWPHNYEVLTPIYRDWKRLKHYACCGELGRDNRSPNGLGTFIHEFSHVIGLADHYTTNGAHSEATPGFWDIMDWGGYLGEDVGRTPCNYSAYQRMALDWASPVATLDAQAASVTLPVMTDQVYFVKLETGRANDYYLLEVRDRAGLDINVPGRGMLIWHIDATHPNLTSSPNNNEQHMAVDLIRADNKSGTYDSAGDVWPGSSNNTYFGESSTPPMTRWESSSSNNRVTVSGRDIRNIYRSNVNGSVSFDYKGGSDTNVISPFGNVDSGVITVVATPAAGGRVSVGSDPNTTTMKVHKGESLYLYATPNLYYNFKEWTYNGKAVSYGKNLFIVVNDDNTGTYTAHFVRQPGAPINYCTPGGNLEVLSQFGTRYTDKLTVSTGETDTNIGPLQTTGTSPLFYDCTGQTVTAAAGSQVTITPGGTGGLWRHVYFYVDWNEDGFEYSSAEDYLNPGEGYAIRPEADLMFYSNWSPASDDNWYTSMESFYNTSEPSNYEPCRPFTITIPATAKPGTYRARFKCHWNSLDPCGGMDEEQNPNNTLAHMGGVVADFTLIVTPAPVRPFYTLQALSSPEEGGSALVNGKGTVQLQEGDPAEFLAEPADGYVFLGWQDEQQRMLSESPLYSIEAVSAADAGVYVALFEPLPKGIPSGKIDENIYAAEIYTTGGYEDMNISYMADAHPGSFHNMLTETSPVWVGAGESFTLHLNCPESEAMSNCAALLFSDWENSGEYLREGLYAPSDALAISHLFTAPAGHDPVCGKLRVLFLDQRNGNDGNFDHITAESTGLLHGGISYDIPVEIVKTVTSVDRLPANREDTVIFDLQGRRLLRIASPGIYIVDGRKVIVTR